MNEEAGTPYPTNPAGWHRLPIEILEKILSLLSISTIIICKNVCRSWRSIIQSDLFISSYRISNQSQSSNKDLFFLLFADFEGPSPFAAAYNPSVDRWIACPFPRFFSSVLQAHVSDGSLLLLERDDGSLLVYNAFNQASKSIPPMISNSDPKAYAIDLIEESSSRFKIVAVRFNRESTCSLIYDSESGSWVKNHQHFGAFALLGNTACLDGILYCLSYGPDHLLAFDPSMGEWNLVDMSMPDFASSHLMAYRGVLFLVGGIKDVVGYIGSIVICRLVDKQWVETCSMPEPIFEEFRGSKMCHFSTVHRFGNVCFYSHRSHRVVMYDLLSMRWWFPSPCPYNFNFEDEDPWFGHALEPRIEIAQVGSASETNELQS